MPTNKGITYRLVVCTRCAYAEVRVIDILRGDENRIVVGASKRGRKQESSHGRG
jgi:hypothetical protein